MLVLGAYRVQLNVVAVSVFVQQLFGEIHVAAHQRHVRISACTHARMWAKIGSVLAANRSRVCVLVYSWHPRRTAYTIISVL